MSQRKTPGYQQNHAQSLSRSGCWKDGPGPDAQLCPGLAGKALRPLPVEAEPGAGVGAPAGGSGTSPRPAPGSSCLFAVMGNNRGHPSLQAATPHFGIHECGGGLGPLSRPRKWLCLECGQEGGLQRPGREQWAWWPRSTETETWLSGWVGAGPGREGPGEEGVVCWVPAWVIPS